jgi:hypothetical protein
MTRDEQARNGDSSNAASDAVSAEDRLPKELLSSSNANRCLRLSWPGRWSYKMHLIALKEINFAVFVFREQIMKQLLALWPEPFHIALKLLPDAFVLFRPSGKPFDATRTLHWIKRREIAELHGKTAGRPSHSLGNVDDDWIISMKLTEVQLAVEVQRDQRMLPRPPHTGCLSHAGIVGESGRFTKLEIQPPLPTNHARPVQTS